MANTILNAAGAGGIEHRVKTFLKSVAAGVVGTGLFFCFFMLLSIPVLAALARLHTGEESQLPGIVIAPMNWFRYAGLPLSGIAFALCFAAGWRRFRSARP